MKILFGSQNFGYDTDQSDKDYLEFIYPTWDDILNNRMYNVEIKQIDDSMIKTKDIRLLLKMIEKPTVGDLQILYSTEYINCEDIKWFIQNRNKLLHYDKQSLCYHTAGVVKRNLREVTPKSLTRARAHLRTLKQIIENDNTESFIDKSNLDFRSKLDSLGECHIELFSIRDDLRSQTEQFEKEVYAREYKVDTETLRKAQEEMIRLLKQQLGVDTHDK